MASGFVYQEVPLLPSQEAVRAHGRTVDLLQGLFGGDGSQWITLRTGPVIARPSLASVAMPVASRNRHPENPAV
jgi:hypothetical protein